MPPLVVRLIRLIVLLAVPLASAAAQAEFRVRNWTVHPGPFAYRFRFEFRNTQDATDQPIRAIRGFLLGLSEESLAQCVPRTICRLGGMRIDDAANVDRANYTFGGQRLLYAHMWGEDSCTTQCWSRRYYYDGTTGLFGCSLPLWPGPGPVVWYYGGRTCAADGFDGWLGMEMSILIEVPGTFTFSPSDLGVKFLYHDYTLPNAFLVPEPAGVALLTAGLVPLALAERRRRRARRERREA